ncbi:uncharacterized protein JN550_002033 [Neoarthrinium moseri]|uniref:uncharacterized protein n=1 Tax=Neoarthrinium moseri TaxID=1658444 RepID=UPI001FDBACE7|nr:uncharacterized protein JN550_002033 [Neoarthrinium moseri]KAI1875747.1 hypothetical protein JN550_002033 [Neoarthrinium moseri]
MAKPQEIVFDNSGKRPLNVPGFNCPYDIELGSQYRFQHGANDFTAPRLTAREIAMLRVMNALTDKPNWHSKILDEAISEKWRAEALGMPLMSEKSWAWCLQELREKAKDYQEKQRVLCLDSASRVCKSDTLVGEDVRSALNKAVQPLLNIPDDKKDWHPNSNDQVLNLIHPSLYPLVFGTTQALVDGGEVKLGDLTSYAQTRPSPVPEVRENTSNPYGYHRHGVNPSERWSRRFQWLPCEVQFNGDSETGVRITSYINNLHPRHQDLYAAIEKVLSLAIEPWNDILIHGKSYHGRTPVRIKTCGAQFSVELPDWYEGLWEIERKKDEQPKAYEEALAKVKDFLTLPNSDVYQDTHDSDDEDDIPLQDPAYIEEYGLPSAVEEKHKRVRTVLHPEPGVSFSYDQWKAGQVSNGVVNPYRSSGWGRREIDPFAVTHKFSTVDLRRDFSTQGLQVIVKLSSIELTPEKTSYAGGNWHIEGMLNEHIVATAIYYYDVENVSESRISFRNEAGMDDENLQYEQDVHGPLIEIFDVEGNSLRDEPALQTLGSVSTPQGRLIAFPNTLQHKVEPFQLVDKTKAGHRRFLVLWLVDPHYRVASTRNVPPQQHDWWAPEGYDKVDFSKLPPEILKMVTSEVGDWPMGLETAKKLRLDLMEERTRGQQAIDAGVAEYNFCEH